MTHALQLQRRDVAIDLPPTPFRDPGGDGVGYQQPPVQRHGYSCDDKAKQMTLSISINHMVHGVIILVRRSSIRFVTTTFHINMAPCPHCTPGSGNDAGHRGRHLGKKSGPRAVAPPAPRAAGKRKAVATDRREFHLNPL